MRRTLVLLLVLAGCGDRESAVEEPAPRARVASPLVTFVRGDVRLGGEPAPAVPFRVPEDGALTLGDGAHAVVLIDHRPHRLDGPSEVDLNALRTAPSSSEEAAAIREVLASPPPRAVVDDLLRAPAPSDIETIRLVVGEGVPGASSMLGRVEWRCEGDCAREVELRDGRDRVIWRAQGEGSVAYDGPALEAPAEYSLHLGDRTYRVETLPRVTLDELLGAMDGWSLADQMSVVAALHHWRGSRAAAVATLRSALRENRQDPDLLALLAAYGGSP